jgi:hypothetical protein
VDRPQEEHRLRYAIVAPHLIADPGSNAFLPAIAFAPRIAYPSHCADYGLNVDRDAIAH